MTPMKSFTLQKTNLESWKQRVHLAILLLLGLLLLMATAIALAVFDPSGGRKIFLLQRKDSVATIRPGAVPSFLRGTWSNELGIVHGLQLTANTNVWYWELHLREPH